MTDPAAPTRLGLPERLEGLAWAPVPIRGFVVFRVLFGLLMCLSMVRFLWMGWVEAFYLEPDFHFHYLGLSAVKVLPAPYMYGAFVVLALLGLCVAAGLWYRLACAGFFVLFTYVELIDVTYYLNHYYLVSLLIFLMIFLPLHRGWSLDARRDPSRASRTLPAWMGWLLKGQVALVYFYAGLAKLGSDWLLHAQPLNLWMSSRVDTPLAGPWLDQWNVALFMSWGGFVFDTTIWLFLLWPRTRKVAYGAVILFHCVTGYLFHIGMFPLIMMVAATVFFIEARPSTPQPTQPSPQGATRRPLARLALGAALIWLVFQAALPLRCWIYPGDVLWHEQGMRWAWKVMVREKNGSVTYRVKLPERSRDLLVPPRRYLTAQQEREMSGQPDLILQLAHHIGQDFLRRGHKDVQVRVDALVSLNARPALPLIDPSVDLMTVRDGLAPADWILPGPTSKPPRLNPTPNP